MNPNQPLVTIVAVTREKFSFVPEFLEGIYKHSGIPFRLVYVDGGSPKKIKNFLEVESVVRGFTLIRTPHFLSPTTARNIGLACVETPYVVFLDNDVAVEQGWLEALVGCAQETEADAVGPLIAETWDPVNLIHFGGGDLRIDTEETESGPKRHLYKKVRHNGRRAEETRGQLEREPTEYVELHCALFRTSIFRKVGFFDERLACEDHTDLSYRIQEAAGKMFFEPKAYVTYVSKHVKAMDIPFFMMRWCDRWQVRSLAHLVQKWGAEQSEFYWKRVKRTHTFRHKYVIGPLSQKILGGLFQGFFAKILTVIDGLYDRWICGPYFEKKATSKPLSYPSHLLFKERKAEHALTGV